MKNPAECMEILKKNIKKEWKIAFFSAFLLGFLVHFPAWINDIPNHDGLASVYFDQNMITSGRWFLTVACGLTSYYTLPWLIGVLSLLWIAVTAVLLIEVLQVFKTEWIVVISGLLVSFPALASTYAYVFTADGYMFGMMLAVLAVYLTQKYKKGFLFGGVCLAFSMGTYQSYLPICILLCLYAIIQDFLSDGIEKDSANKKAFLKIKITTVTKYFGMGVIGVSLYYIVLQVLLRIQGKVLDTYQGINGMTAIGGDSIVGTVTKMYRDFVTFILKGNVLFNNAFSLVAVVIIGVMFVLAMLYLIRERKLYRNIWFWIVGILLVIIVPLATNIILFISPDVGYHLLMRYQYVFLVICGVAFISNYGKRIPVTEWCLLSAGVVLCFNFAVSDNIGYSNLQKRYEKTYAYCLRLADRIEQTEGYYTGMPVVIMGMVGDENFPSTDITTDVTGNMIGLCGDFLCYNGTNYQDFFKHYLGITIEIVDQDTVGEIYNTSAIYQSLDSFPGANCTQVVDGVLYVRTENELERSEWPDTIVVEE